MRIIARSTLTKFAAKNPAAATEIHAWFSVASAASWKTAAAIKATYGNASIINAERVVFNIAGNKYRLVVAVNYRLGILFIKFIGSHAAYDLIDAATVAYKD